MIKKRGNPQKLKEINKQRREKTLNSIGNAVGELKSLGFQPTIKRIMEITTLSRGTFELDHIKELMIDLKIGKYAKLQIDNPENKIEYDEYIKLNKEVLLKDKQIEKQKRVIKKLEKQNDENIKENEILRMKIYELQLEKDILMPLKINK